VDAKSYLTVPFQEFKIPMYVHHVPTAMSKYEPREVISEKVGSAIEQGKCEARHAIHFPPVSTCIGNDFGSMNRRSILPIPYIRASSPSPLSEKRQTREKKCRRLGDLALPIESQFPQGGGVGSGRKIHVLCAAGFIPPQQFKRTEFFSKSSPWVTNADYGAAEPSSL
jgi:hypothetical protein